MQKNRLRKYARLIARMGCNVQKGQDVQVNCGIDQPEFVAMVTDELYKAGARRVMVDFSYQPLSKLHYRHCSLKTLSTLENFEEAKLQYAVEKLPCRLHLMSADPDGLKGVNMDKLSRSQQILYPLTKGYRDQLDGKQQWCIAAVPGVKWAKKVFPGERAGTAVEKLWDAILSCARVDDDPIAAWEKHNADMQARCEYLNNLQIDKLVYHSANGTDLEVGMIPDAVFCGGGETTKGGVYFNPNIPTEECFISPDKNRAEGIVYSSLPLSYRGQLIENFWMRFEKGAVVEAHAEVNDAALQQMIHMDEGASRLGECALVPFNSPINQTGLLFHNTLFDENAVCHLALGRGFADTIRDHHEKSHEEIHALGVNESMIHVDFMIGTEDLSVEAVCHDGKRVQIFKDGTWAW